MKQNEFVHARKAFWQRYREVLENTGQDHPDFPRMYRSLCHDLAIARARRYSPVILEQLNELLLLGQQHLYRPQNRLLISLKEYFSVTLPNNLMALRTYLLVAHALLFGGMVLAALITWLYPDFIYMVMGHQQVADFEWMYDPKSEHFGKERASDSDFQMFGFYIYNNISIAFKTFVGGILLGLGTLFIVGSNALSIGAVSGHVINIGYQETFFSFVVTHGAFELTAIAMAAAAGLAIGVHFVNPGRMTRSESLRQAGKLTFPMVIATFIFLLIAAFIEAFWSSSQTIPAVVKYSVGGFCWAMVLYYLFKRRPYGAR